MALAIFAPAGTATSNDDAVRQSNSAAFFNSFEGLLVGIDDQPRYAPAQRGSQVLGFGTAMGVDIGVGNNGDFFVRGRVGAGDASGETTSGQAAAPFRITPGLLLLCVAAFLILKK